MSSLRQHALAVWHAAVAAADPFERVRAFLTAPDGPAARTAAAGGRIAVLGGGKAGPGMAAAAEAALAGHLDRVTGLINVPEGSERPLRKLTLWPARPAGSNHPAEQGVVGVGKQFELADELRPGDLALCLLSGGGSALLPAPAEGVTLADKQETTRLLHACGATIDEMNCVRKHLSRYKGGRLAQRLVERGCQTVSLIVSDVIGDPLDVIASGPTAPDPTTFADALAVLGRFDLLDRVPAGVKRHLERGAAGEVPETPKELPASVRNVILCNNAGSLAAAQKEAEKLGYRVLNLGSFIEGETRQVATAVAGIVRSIRHDGVPFRPPVCLLLGGETTVTLGANPGKGGRNQEFVLGVMAKLAERELPGVVVLSGGTDGEDGPTDAAGAVADLETWRAAAGSGLDAAGHLSRHDAYPFFAAAGGLVKTGLTQTNVMDVRVVLVAALAERG